MYKPQSILFLSNHSFFGRLKLGMHYLALGLAEKGYDVHWVPCPATPFDIIGSQRRARLARLLFKRHDRGVAVAPRLTEYTLPALFNPTKKLLHFRWQLHTYAPLLPNALKNRSFDVCVFDVSPTVVYLPHIKAGKYVFRINDPLERQAKCAQELFRKALSDEFASTLCCVSDATAAWVKEAYPNRKTIVLPNGLALADFPLAGASAARDPKSALLTGWFGEWVDFALLDQAAALLPDWRLDVYGFGPVRPKFASPNVRCLGPLAPSAMPSTMASYQVGLIPNKERDGDMRFVECPLKFYAYLAAGMGVAATTCGSARNGMGEFAFFGDTPEAYARAIVQAAEWANGARNGVAGFIARHDWPVLVDRFETLCLPRD